MPASGTLSHTLLKVLHAALQRYSKSTDTRSGVQRTLLVSTTVLWAVERSSWLRLLKAGDSVNLLERKIIKQQHLIWPERVAMEKAFSEKQEEDRCYNGCKALSRIEERTVDITNYVKC